MVAFDFDYFRRDWNLHGVRVARRDCPGLLPHWRLRLRLFCFQHISTHVFARHLFLFHASLGSLALFFPKNSPSSSRLKKSHALGRVFFSSARVFTRSPHHPRSGTLSSSSSGGVFNIFDDHDSVKCSQSRGI